MTVEHARSALRVLQRVPSTKALNAMRFLCEFLQFLLAEGLFLQQKLRTPVER